MYTWCFDISQDIASISHNIRGIVSGGDGAEVHGMNNENMLTVQPPNVQTKSTSLHDIHLQSDSLYSLFHHHVGIEPTTVVLLT